MTNPIFFIFLLGFFVRLTLAFLPGFQIDLNDFRFWSLKLAEVGPWNFYQGNFFSDYTPGYLYILGFFGFLSRIFLIDTNSQLFTLFLKLPSIVFDILAAYLLYQMLRGQKKTVQIGSTVIYLFHPAVLFIGPIWGQIDGILSFLLLLICFFLIKNRPVWASIATTLAFWVKPQTIAIFPILIYFLLKNYDLKIIFKGIFISFLLSFLIVLPFFPNAPFQIVSQLSASASVYPYTSFFAYNFWALFGMFEPDDLLYLGLPLRIWGVILFLLAISPLPFLLKKKGANQVLYGFSLAVMAFFLFTTRMHERYLFPFILLFLLTAAYSRKTVFYLVFAGISLVHFFNLYAAYSYYNNTIIKIEPLAQVANSLVTPFSLFTLFAYVILIFVSVIDYRK